MRIVPFMVLPHEVVIPVLLGAVLGLNVPEQEGPKWVPLHEAIEQPLNLLRLPDELTLNRGKNVFARISDFAVVP